MSEALTRSLGTFVSGLRLEAIPSDALGVVRTGFADSVATLIAGSVEDAPAILHKTLAPPPGDATLYLAGPRVPAPEAAWINGTAAHALDYDDVALRGHPSTVLVPTILAEGEALGSTGAELATAYVAGYEVWADLQRRDPAQHHEKGWHPTGIFGPIGAAAACASLRRLDADSTARALALAASQSSGVMANFGTMTKPFHAGRSAHSGLMSARLAELGFTASQDALEHPQGFLSAVSPEGAVDRESPPKGLGSEWWIIKYRLGIKKYPACYCTHRALDAMLELLAHHPLKPEEIARITVSLSDTHALILRNHQPQTGLAAKFSMEFAMAAAVISRRAGLAEYTDGFVRRPEVQDLMRRVGVETNQNYDPEVSGASVFDQVRVELVGGGVVESEKVTRAKGHADRPLSEDELFEKFRTCLDAGGAKIAPGVLFDRLRHLEDLSARELTTV